MQTTENRKKWWLKKPTDEQNDKKEMQKETQESYKMTQNNYKDNDWRQKEAANFKEA